MSILRFRDLKFKHRKQNKKETDLKPQSVISKPSFFPHTMEPHSLFLQVRILSVWKHFNTYSSSQPVFQAPTPQKQNKGASPFLPTPNS